MSDLTPIGLAVGVLATAAGLACFVTSRERPSRTAGERSNLTAPARTHVNRDDPSRDDHATGEPRTGPFGERGIARDNRAHSPERPSELIDLASSFMLRERARSPGDPASAMRNPLASVDLGDDELLALLSYHCDIESSDIPRDVSVFEHAARVASVGARGIATEPRFYGRDLRARFPTRIEFAVATDESNAPLSPAGEFSPAAGRIFATFASETVGGPRVLVKWTHLDTRTIHVFRTYDVEPRADHNFVWMQPRDDWRAGTYAVEVYAMDRDLRPIAGGQYVVRR